MWKWLSRPIKFLLVSTTLLSIFLTASPSRANTVQTEYLTTLQFGKIRFDLHRGLNANGEFEVAVEYFEFRRGLPDSSTVVLYGRDLNADGKPELWLIPGENGDVQALFRESKVENGWDVIPDILIRNVGIENRSIASMIFNVVGTTLSFALAKQNTFFQAMVREEMDILDLEYRVDLLSQAGWHPKKLLPYMQLISDLRESQVKKINHEFAFEMTLAGVDGFVAVAGPRVMSKLAEGYKTLQASFVAKLTPSLGRMFQFVSKKPLSKAISAIYSQYKTAVLGRAKLAAARLNRWTFNAGPQVVRLAARPIAWTLEQRARMATKALTAQTLMSRTAWKAANSMAALASEGAIRIPYVLQTTLVQWGAELQHRKEAFETGDPIIIEQNEREMAQNIGYMAGETMMMATVTQAMNNLSKRMAICGGLAFSNSLAFSFVMNGEPNMARQSLDTRWEVVVGNLQTQIDIEALQFFEHLTQQNGRPRLKLIGYAVAIVNQYVGYRAYAWATSKIGNREEKPTLQLIPIMIDELPKT